MYKINELIEEARGRGFETKFKFLDIYNFVITEKSYYKFEANDYLDFPDEKMRLIFVKLTIDEQKRLMSLSGEWII